MSGRYTISRTRDCIVIDGAVPVNDLAALMRAWEKEQDSGAPWIIDGMLSSHLNCNMVIGPPDACAAWRERLGLVEVGPPRPYRWPPHGEVSRCPPPPSLVCPRCGRRTYNPHDPTNRHCGHCDANLDDRT